MFTTTIGALIGLEKDGRFFPLLGFLRANLPSPSLQSIQTCFLH